MPNTMNYGVIFLPNTIKFIHREVRYTNKTNVKSTKAQNGLYTEFQGVCVILGRAFGR